MQYFNIKFQADKISASKTRRERVFPLQSLDIRQPLIPTIQNIGYAKSHIDQLMACHLV